MAENKKTEHESLEEIESHVPESMHPILEAAFKYHKQLITVVVAIIAVAAIYAGVTAYNQRNMVTAQNELGTILIEAKGEDKINRLEALLGSAPSSVKPAVLLELAQTSMNNSLYDKAEGYWNQLSGETDADLAFVARLGKAKCLTLAGKNADAVTELNELVGIAPETFIVPVYRQLAVAAELAGDKPLALETYRKLAEQSVADKPFIDFKITQLEAK